MDDSISRQTVLAMLDDIEDEVMDGEGYQYGKWSEYVEQLPSAQPEIIRCKDCKHSEHWYKDKRRCFLWAEDGIDVFDDGYCNYADMRGGEQESEIHSDI